MKMKTSAAGIASLIEQVLQESFADGPLKDFEPDPSEIVVTIRQDPMVPGGWAIAAKGRELGLVTTLTQWLQSGDTGVSSKAIFAAITGQRGVAVRDDENWPHDPSDFGRCFRLLERFPTWRTELRQVVAKYPAWAPIIAVWPELEALYVEELQNKDGMAPKLYARLQTLGDECRVLSGWTKTASGWERT